MARLRAATRRSVFSGFPDQEGAGIVRAARLSLYRVAPVSKANPFKPKFKGRFIERDGKTFLTGHFTLGWFVKDIFCVWFGGLLYPLGMVLVAAMQRNARLTFASLETLVIILLAVVCMWIVGIAFAWGGRWHARSDIDWLFELITRTLTPPYTL